MLWVCGVWCACANARCVCVQAAGRRHRAVRGDVVVAHEAHVAGAGRRLRRRVLRRRQRHHQFRRVAPPPSTMTRFHFYSTPIRLRCMRLQNCYVTLD